MQTERNKQTGRDTEPDRQRNVRRVPKVPKKRVRITLTALEPV